eukprot:scaffold2244_cov91-Isochrysis_galbana.AAC.3
MAGAGGSTRPSPWLRQSPDWTRSRTHRRPCGPAPAAGRTARGRNATTAAASATSAAGGGAAERGDAPAELEHRLLGLPHSIVQDKGHESLEPVDAPEDARRVRGKLVRSKDVGVVHLPRGRVGHGQHVDRLGALADGGVDRGRAACQQRLVDAKDQSRQVEGA